MTTEGFWNNKLQGDASLSTEIYRHDGRDTKKIKFSAHIATGTVRYDFDTESLILGNKVLNESFVFEMRQPIYEEIIWWKNMHIRHKIRFVIAGAITIFAITSLLFNIIGLPTIWLPFDNLIILIGGIGLVVTSTYLAIDDVQQKQNIPH